MARPVKPGLDYFPLDVVLDDKFRLIEAEFGLDGFALVVKLLQKIYGGQGYYCEWTYDVELLFTQDCGVGVNFVSELIKGCTRRDFFNPEMLSKYQILTSRGIQKRYLEGKRGDISKIKKEYLLLELPIKDINATETGVNATKTRVNVATMPQSKEKKSKVKKSIVECRRIPTLEEVTAYIKEIGGIVDAQRFYNHYQSNGWKSGGYVIEDWKAKVRRWDTEDRQKGRQSQKADIKPTKFVNYNQPTYTKEEIDEIVKRKKRKELEE